MQVLTNGHNKLVNILIDFKKMYSTLRHFSWFISKRIIVYFKVYSISENPVKQPVQTQFSGRTHISTITYCLVLCSPVMTSHLLPTLTGANGKIYEN